MKEVVRCYQRQDRKSLGGPWEEKNCVLFVFTKCIIIAEMVNNDLKYWKNAKNVSRTKILRTFPNSSIIIHELLDQLTFDQFWQLALYNSKQK